MLNLSSWNVGLAFHKAIQGVDMRWWTQAFLSEPAHSLTVLRAPYCFLGRLWSPIPALQSGRSAPIEKGWVTWTCLIPSPTCQSSCHSLSLHKKKSSTKLPKPTLSTPH